MPANDAPPASSVKKGATPIQKLTERHGIQKVIHVMRFAGERQERFIRSLISRLREDADYASVARYADLLEQEQTALNDTVARRETVYSPEAQAQANRRLIADDARRLYLATYHKLQLLYPQNPMIVESFFLDLTPGSSAASAENDSSTGDKTTDGQKTPQ